MPTVRWFGASWGAPVCDPAQHTATPVGMVCSGHDHLHSDRSSFIVSGDQGVTLPYYGRTDRVERVAYHLDCWLHEVGADRLPGGRHRGR
jgi:hypothetical protein